ncbi:MAG: ergothioneine biosynthesis glutamate--cysteine ligase EgtA [Kineosporiaceae bacterium]
MSVVDEGHPAPQILTESAAEGWLPHICFANGPPGRVGVELEQVLLSAGPAPGAVPRARHQAVLADVAAAGLVSRLTVEPGGQLELSGPPCAGLAEALAVMDDDLALLRRCAARRGVRATGVGLDPWSPPRRLLRQPRYEAMEAYFDGTGRAGRLMMCSTASVQVSVEAGAGPQDPAGVLARRWDVLHGVGPALVAAFANSPLHEGRPTGWASTRTAVWAALDAARTRAPARRPGESLAEAYVRWALDAPLMMVRRDTGSWTAPDGVTFRQWLRHGADVVAGRPGPTPDDLGYHLTTLFPPVRARGHLEVRYVDAQPGPWWQVPVAVLSTLADDVRAADEALAACEPTASRWLDAARQGLRDNDLYRAAVQVLDVTARRLSAATSTRPAAALVEQYLDRWTLRRRSPGDDLLDAAGSGRRSVVGGRS